MDICPTSLHFRSCPRHHPSLLSWKSMGSLIAPALLEWFSVHLRFQSQRTEMILSLTLSTTNMVFCRLRLMDFKIDFFQIAGIKHPAVGALSRLKTTETDQTSIEDKILIVSITTCSFRFHSNHKRKDKALFFHAYDVIKNKEGVRLLTFYGIASGTKYVPHGRPMAFHSRTNPYTSRRKRRIVSKPHPQLYFWDLRSYTTRRDFQSVLPLWTGWYRKLLLLLCEHVFHFILITQDFARHPNEGHLYKSMRKEHYWSHIANDV